MHRHAGVLAGSPVALFALLLLAVPARADPGHFPGRAGSVGLEITSRWITAHRALTRSLSGDLWRSGVFLRTTTGSSAYASSPAALLRGRDGGARVFASTVIGYQFVAARGSLWVALGAMSTAFSERRWRQDWQAHALVRGVAAGLRGEAGFHLPLGAGFDLAGHVQAEAVDRAWSGSVQLARKLGAVSASIEVGGIGNRDFHEVRTGAGLSLRPLEAVSMRLAAGLGFSARRRTPYVTLTTAWSY
jgi:hypothetical protein